MPNLDGLRLTRTIAAALDARLAESPRTKAATLMAWLEEHYPSLRRERRERLVAQALARLRGLPVPSLGGARAGAGRLATRKLIRDGGLYLIVDGGQARGEFRARIHLGTIELVAANGDRLTIIEEG
jgi:hypothetical protein